MYYELLLGGILCITSISCFIVVPIYILVLAVIITHRHVEPFNSEFFVIFFALGVVDIICYLLFLSKKVFFFGFVPYFFQPYNQANFYAPLYYYPFWIFGFFQYQLTFVLTVNRFVSIVWPGFYNLHWTIGKTYALIAICAASCILITIPAPLSNCTVTEYAVSIDGVNRTFHYGPVTMDSKTGAYLTKVWSGHVYGLVISSVIFYGIMILVLRKKKLGGNKKKLEMQMFYVGFMVFVTNLVFTFYFFLRDYVLVNATGNPHLHEWILYFISDVYDLPNGLMLWFTSASIRRIVGQFARRHLRCGAVDVITIISGRKSTEQDRRPPTATAMPTQTRSTTTRQATLMFVD